LFLIVGPVAVPRGTQLFVKPGAQTKRAQ
jgi:hypothetical protein